MSKVTQEVTAVVGKYKDQNGQEKNRYQRIGSVIETKNGPMLKFDCMPIVEGGWSGWCYLNKPKDQAPSKIDDSDFPF